MKTLSKLTRSPKFSRQALSRYALPALFASLIFSAACGEEDDHDHQDHAEECGGFGHLHGDECHCDEGYEPAPSDPTMCVAQ